jgi:hypothetical protein
MGLFKSRGSDREPVQVEHTVAPHEPDLATEMRLVEALDLITRALRALDDAPLADLDRRAQTCCWTSATPWRRRCRSGTRCRSSLGGTDGPHELARRRHGRRLLRRHGADHLGREQVVAMGNICECGDPQSQHRASKYGCRALECVCTKYVLDIPATKRARFAADHGTVEPDADAVLARVALPVIEIQPEPVADDGVPEEPRVLNAAERGPQPIPPGWSPDGASTLARLAQVERERDEALAKLAKPCGQCHPCENSGALQDLQAVADSSDLLRTELASAKQELERLRAVPVPDVDLEGRLAEARAELDVLRESLKGSASTATVALRDLAESRGEVDRCMQQQGLTLRDLAEARTEVDNLRLSRDAAESQLAEARGVIDFMDGERAAPAASAGNVLASYDRWFCQPITGCGKTAHQPDDDHECGPLIRATVTITH